MPPNLLLLSGSMLVLVAYLMLQLHWLRPRTVLFEFLNLAGAGLLSWEAYLADHTGFLLFFGSWGVVSLLFLLRRPRPPSAVPPAPSN